MPRRFRHPWGFALTLLACAASGAAAQDAIPSAEAVRFFESKVRPVLAEHCYRCHGPEKQKGHLRVDGRSHLLTGGELGPALVPGDPEKSLLLKAVRQVDPELKMPPSGKLQREQIDALTQWVKAGAPWPGDVKAAAAPARKGDKEITAKDREHWAFQPVRRPAVPTVGRPEWIANPIDAFILAKLESKGLTPNPPADQGALLRRAYFNVTGLPPTPAEVDAFLTDPSPKAYDAVVEKLLASPRYGEKWAHHWLDLVRYAETNSYERDNPKPHVWRYRDYVIRSFNADKPYDRFVKEQLAGDEMPDAGVDQLVATGFYRLGVWDDEPSNRLQDRYDGLDDIVTTVGQSMLALTLDCARCHAHKIDPIQHADYYRFLAFFHNINHYRNGGPTDEAPLFRDTSDKEAFAAEARRLEERRREVEAGIRQIEKDLKAVAPDKSRLVMLKKLKKELEGLRDPMLAAAQEKALIVTEAGPRPPETFVFLRGNPGVNGPRVEPGFPLVLGFRDPVLPEPVKGAKSSGRRTVLAEWIASRDNPLTARVIVNRIWQNHFGRAIVRSPSNFGTQGDRPTHPELLDWLAAELMDSGWSLKHVHRLILTSNAYRLSSRSRPEALKADATNDLFWRFDMRRLCAEEIRDSILAVSGNLNLAMYGRSVYPEIPAQVLAGQSVPGRGWTKSSSEEQARRSVYVHVKRSLLLPILDAFDLAEPDRTTPTRFSSTQPTQALLMLNSDFINQQASIFADRLRREAGDDVTRQVRLGLSLTTGRTPTAAELRRATALVAALRQRDGASEAEALRYFCLMALNLNEFMYLD